MRILGSLLVGVWMLQLGTAAWAEPRVFTDVKGRKMEAEILELIGDTQIKIRRKGGAVFTVERTVFSEADQEFIRDWDLKRKGMPTELDPRVKPGAEITLEFSELGETQQDKVAGTTIRIPESFEYPKPVPLLIWIGGGKGTDTYRPILSCADPKDFVLAALPYPKDVETPADAAGNGSIGEIWDFQKVILAKILELVPNTDPRLRVVMGFSNGAHTIGSGLSLGWDEFEETFNVFVMIDGGGTTNYEFGHAAKKHVYFAYGETSPSLDFCEAVLGNLESSRATLHSHLMEGVAHKFPPEEKTLVKNWLYQKVMPELLSVQTAE